MTDPKEPSQEDEKPDLSEAELGKLLDQILSEVFADEAQSVVQDDQDKPVED